MYVLFSFNIDNLKLKMNRVYYLVLVGVLIHQAHTSSVTKEVFVSTLKTVNFVTDLIDNEANVYLLKLLQNETQIKEASVNIQMFVVTDLLRRGFSLLKDLPQNKLTDCLVTQETVLTEAFAKAASDNGWCNNRLAANLTKALQGVTGHLVEKNWVLQDYLHSYEFCILEDDICFNDYVENVSSYVLDELSPSGESLLTAIEEVRRVSVIMFGNDVPFCSKEYLLPEIADGIHESAKNIFDCVTSL